MPDIIDTEFEYAYQQFVEDGGLDDVHPISEDWERMQRQSVYCSHYIHVTRCKYCKKALDSKYGTSSW